MATVQQIFADVRLRYRNTFTDAQLLVWLIEEQRELYEILKLDSPPYAFDTVEGENFYPFPADFDITKIKTVTYQVSDADDPKYIELPFRRNDDLQFTGYQYWYTVTSDAMYLHVPGGVPATRRVYVFCDADPSDVTVDGTPDLPVRFQEILKLGILKRIAMARKDIEMYNNYDAEHEQKITDLMWGRNVLEPEWVSPTDVMPHAGRRWRGGSVAIYIAESET